MCKCKSETMCDASCTDKSKTLFRVGDVCTLENGISGWVVIGVDDKHVVFLRGQHSAIVRKADGTSWGTTFYSNMVPPKRTKTVTRWVGITPADMHTVTVDKPDRRNYWEAKGYTMWHEVTFEVPL